jgi:selenocysteine lyase/cysteine desulfurase
MTMNRRKFLLNTSLAGAGSLLVQCSNPAAQQSAAIDEPVSFDTWEAIQKQFRLDPGRIHMTQMLLASHPKPVRDAIEKHRDSLDANPMDYYENNVFPLEKEVRRYAAEYMGVTPEELALTDSTTMGLAMMYSGLQLKAGDEIVTTTHDHYSTEKSLEYAAAKTGAVIKRVSLYESPSQASIDTMVSTLKKAITPKTRIVAVTHVHSWTGVKTPIREIGAMVREVNASRAGNRIYFCVDGVHGFGVENINISEIGCDFFVAGTHKWIFGPRGTGVFYARKDAWDVIAPIIPCFELSVYGAWMGVAAAWMGDATGKKFTFADLCTPGGFHSFEHRWALADAFKWQLTIGKSRVEERTHALSKRLKEGMKAMAHINLLTPMDEALSSGINCFLVKDQNPEETIKRLLAKNITASVTPYKAIYARLTPSIVNNEAEVDAVLKALEGIRV